MELVFARELADAIEANQVRVLSGGTHAFDGSVTCDISLAMVGRANYEKLAIQVTPEILDEADLIITAEARHVHSVRTLAPRKAAVTFTARQAARLAPLAKADSLAGLVAEFDAHRGHPAAAAPESILPHDPDDIPDPHIVGFSVHRMSADYILETTTSISMAVRQVLSAG